MNNTFYFLRHGKTKVEKDVLISKWVLSSEGEAQAQKVMEGHQFDDLDVIITSGETKAYQTAKPLADRLGKEIIQYADLNELDRDEGGFMDVQTYEEVVKEAMAHP